MTADLPRFALSVRQPWAWAIIHGGKDIENRSAGAVAHGMHPGPLAIHAAKGMTQDEYRHAASFMEEIGVKCPPPAELVRGAIIGHCRVLEIVSEHDSDWFFGPRGLVIAEQEPCKPIPVMGALGFFDWRKGRMLTAPQHNARWMLRYGQDEPAAKEEDGSAAESLPLFEED